VFEVGKLCISCDRASWVPYLYFRRNIYDNKWEHLEYIYFGKFRVVWSWEKRKYGES
jgi:hypothetical protein